MSKMKNYMMDIEEFCDGYYFPDLGPVDFTIDEIVEDAGKYFRSIEAGKYAKTYLTTRFGEDYE